MGEMVYAKTQLYFMVSSVGKIKNKRPAEVFSNRYLGCTVWADRGIS
jgi:hypothetical protein